MSDQPSTSTSGNTPPKSDAPTTEGSPIDLPKESEGYGTQEDGGPISPPSEAPPPGEAIVASQSESTGANEETTSAAAASIKGEGTPAIRSTSSNAAPNVGGGDAVLPSAAKEEAEAVARVKVARVAPPHHVSFNTEVTVAQLKFDEVDEAAQQRRVHEETKQEALEDPRSSDRFYFRGTVGRYAKDTTKEGGAADASAQSKKKHEAEGGNDEVRRDEEATGSTEAPVPAADGEPPVVAATAGGGAGDVARPHGEEGEGSKAKDDSSPVNSRSLREKLNDFRYEADPNERLYWQGLVKIDDQHSKIVERQQLLDKEAEVHRTVYIHKSSKAVQNLPPNATFDDFLENRNQRTKAKAKVWEKKKSKAISDALEDVTFKPGVGKKSEILVHKMKKENRYKNPVTGWEDHFNDFVTKEARMAAQFGQHNVTPNRVTTTQDHFERLYQESAIRQAAQDIVSQAQVAEYSGGNFKPDTQRSYSSLGFDDTSSYSSRTPHELVNSLLTRGEDSKKRIEELRRKSEEDTYTFTPKTNKLSQKMVQSWSERAVTPRGERRGGQYNNDGGVGPARSVHDLSPDIKGVADNQKPRAKFDVDLFYSKMHRNASEREAKLREIEEKQKADELAQCTFRPRTMGYDPSQQQQQSGSFYSGSNSSVTPRRSMPGSVVRAGQPQTSARSTQSQSRTTPRTQRTPATKQQQQQPVHPYHQEHTLEQQQASYDHPSPSQTRQQQRPNSARSVASRGSQRSQAQNNDYAINLTTVPPSSSTPTTARTLLDEDGSTDLAQLQQELMGVIAEWQNIEA